MLVVKKGDQYFGKSRGALTPDINKARTFNHIGYVRQSTLPIKKVHPLWEIYTKAIESLDRGMSWVDYNAARAFIVRPTVPRYLEGFADDVTVVEVKLVEVVDNG